MNYKSKIILSDKLRFEDRKLNKNLTYSIEKLHKKEIIDNVTGIILWRKESRLSYSYDLPKVSKQNTLFMPIISMINSSQHKVAQCLGERFKHVRQ